ncbi:MAG: peptide chain release factor N(5)-glutamine methyltransferase [Candidatus Gracilibacteria bacterium]|nr:peptide chain release factor N(5)-glutamine methyltransferase [Candidatus Gracilibacteria bacterium]
MKINFEFNEEFYSLPFYVDNRVLIPRNDTEILVEKAIKEIDLIGKNIILIDVGTGSSCILTAILKNIRFDLINSFGLDISLDALEVAKINIEKHNLENKTILLNSDLLEIFLNNYSIFPFSKGELEGVYENKTIIITANLPYIKDGDFENIDKNVLENEPHIALFGGEKTGFELYEKLIGQIFDLKKIYKQNIILFIEIGFDQYYYSREFLQNLGLKFEYFKDLNGINRCVKIIF